MADDIGAATPIAIVGLACRFPDADDPAALQEAIVHQRRAFRRLPPERLDLADYYRAEQDAPDATHSTRAALIEGWQFDRAVFGISAAAYAAADPAHWLALETAARALAAAGCSGGAGLNRDRTGVIIGNTLTGDTSRANALRLRWPYVRRVLASALLDSGVPAERSGPVLARAAAGYLAPFPEFGADALAGSVPATIASGISSYLGFRGGSFAVDSGSASALQAVATACAALAAGELDVALAGGVSLSLDPLQLVGLAKAGRLAAREVRIYDECPSGQLPGEGCGVAVLMRSVTARALGLPVYAEVIGWGSSAGSQAGDFSSSAGAHQLALVRAYQRAGVDPADVRLIEGHGAGTAAGEAAELTALSRLRQGARAAAALGSVKANIGDTQAAAGAASLIKTVLAVSSGVIPPATGVSRPHPLLRDSAARLWLPESAEHWPDRTRLAGVSAMGPGGTNVHLVLRADSGRAARRWRRAQPGRPSRRRSAAVATASSRATAAGTGRPEIYLLQAPDRRALAGPLARIAKRAPWLSDSELLDLASRLASEASAQGSLVRVALVAASQDQLAIRASQALALLPQLRVGKLAVRPGIFAADRGDGQVTLLLPDAADVLPDTPGIGATLAALRWLDELGIRPGAAVAHGSGQIAGLAWAGMISDDQALEFAALHAELLESPTVRLRAPARPRGRAARPDGPVSGDDLGTRPDRYDPGTQPDGPADADNPRTRPDGYDPGTQPDGPADADDPRTRPDGPADGADRALADAVSRLRAAFAELRPQPPSRRLLCSATGRQISSANEASTAVCALPGDPARLAQALAAGAFAATLLVETGPGDELAATAGRTCEVPAVSLGQPGPGPGHAQDTARVVAALFAAGALTRPERLFAGRPARPIDLDREPVFIASPCQAGQPRAADGPAGAAAGESLDSAAPAQPASAPAPAQPASAPAPGAVPAPRTALEMAPSVPAPRPAEPGPAEQGSRPPAAQPGPATAAQAGPAEPRTGGALSWAVEQLRPSRRQPAAGDDRPWRVVIAGDIAFKLVNEIFRDEPGAGRTLAILGDLADPGSCAAALLAARDATASGQLVAIGQGDGGAAFWDVLHAEHPGLGITVLRAPAGRAGLLAARDFAQARPGEFAELVISEAGRALEPTRAELPAAGGSFPLGPDDVVLIMPGCRAAGLALAQAVACCGAQLVVSGDPGEADDLTAGLARLKAAGARIARATDRIDAEAGLGATVRRVEGRFGPVTAIAHGPGRSAGVPIDGLTRRALNAELRRLQLPGPGEAGRLRLIVTFGPLVDTRGVAGDGAGGGLQALAASSLAAQAQRTAGQLASCRAVHVEWPEEPVPPDEAARQLLRLLTAPALPTRCALRRAPQAEAPPPADPVWAEAPPPADPVRAEALPPTEPVRAAAPGSAAKPTATKSRAPTDASPAANASPAVARPVSGPGQAAEPIEVSGGRFTRRVLARRPGCELVCEAELSVRTDPYLADYRPTGRPSLPPTMVLEALAQAASALAGRPLRELTDVRLGAPVEVPAGSWQPSAPNEAGVLIRITATADGDRITAVLRCAEPGCDADHARAEFGLGTPDPLASDAARPHADGGQARSGRPPRAWSRPAELPLQPDGMVDGTELYGPVCFQSGRFRRLAFLPEVTARSSRALARGADSEPWFTSAAGDGAPPDPLILGSPGLTDAMLQVLQACVPHRRLGLNGCATATFSVQPPEGAVEIRTAVAAASPGQSTGTRWDAEAVDGAGHTLAAMRGISLADAGPLPRNAAWPPALLSVYLERRGRELGLDRELRVSVQDAAAAGRRAGPLTPDPADGRPETAGPGAAAGRPETAGPGAAAGRPETAGPGAAADQAGMPVADPAAASTSSVAGTGQLAGCTLAVTATAPTACGWATAEPSDGDQAAAWPGLAPAYAQLRGDLAETVAVSAARLRAVAGCLSMAAAPPSVTVSPLRAEDDGWALLDAGGALVACAVVEISGVSCPVAIAMLSGSPGRPGERIPAVAAVPAGPNVCHDERR